MGGPARQEGQPTEATVRLTWQAVTLTLGTMAAAVAAYRQRVAHDAVRGHVLYTLHAIDHGGYLQGDSVTMPGDAADGSYPGEES